MQIPSTLHDMLVSVLQLSSLALQYNSFTGTLPDLWGSLTQVNTLLLQFDHTQQFVQIQSRPCKSTIAWVVAQKEILTHQDVNSCDHVLHASCSLQHMSVHESCNSGPPHFEMLEKIACTSALLLQQQLSINLAIKFADIKLCGCLAAANPRC